MSVDQEQMRKMSAVKKYEHGIGNLFGKTQKQDVTTGIMWLEAAAKHGEERADLILGKIYFEGKFVQEDYNKSIVYLRRASNVGLLEADYYLGQAYYYGKGAKQDYNKAMEYYIKAIHLDNPQVFFLLEKVMSMAGDANKIGTLL